jgi:hypothetical protein
LLTRLETPARGGTSRRSGVGVDPVSLTLENGRASVRKGVDVPQGKSFAPEFRQEAVRLYRVSGRPSFRAVATPLIAHPSRS